jgi:hypothetical protein
LGKKVFFLQFFSAFLQHHFLFCISQAAANQSTGGQVDGNIEWLDPKYSSASQPPISPAESFVSAADVTDSFPVPLPSNGKGLVNNAIILFII